MDTIRMVRPAEGRHLHFLNHLATIKVEGQGSALSVVEFQAARGFGPPLHRHRHEDELFVILEGEIALHANGQAPGEAPVATAGAIAVLPHGIPHTFQVRSDTARFVCVTASGKGHPRFDEMVAALGEPTLDATIPEPAYVDATRVAEVCLEHDIEVLGPPPAPLS
jgi:quercetin dioxygenase-like cupin family protein